MHCCLPSTGSVNARRGLVSDVGKDLDEACEREQSEKA
jgi:hypothetical protein